MAGDRSNTSIVGAATGPPGGGDEAFLQAQEAAQAQRDSQVRRVTLGHYQTYITDDSAHYSDNDLLMDTTYPGSDSLTAYCSKCNRTADYVPRKSSKECLHCSAALHYQCVRCCKLYKDIKYLRQHQRFGCDRGPSYFCNTCGCGFTRKCTLLAHVARKHSRPGPLAVNSAAVQHR